MQQEDEKHLCKFCYKTFPCGRSLGGHMRSHLINISSSDHQKSDPNKKKTFQSCKAHTKSHSVIGEQNRNSSSDHHISQTEPRKKRSNIDHQDQQEVALSLILLSKKIETESGNPFLQRKRSKSDDFFMSTINKVDGFGSEMEKPSKFRCVICKKGFPSYQALGGHRASHKKFKGCCAPIRPENFEPKIETGNKSKDHECPICFKIFQSGQALGGHKRSHLVADQKRAPQIRHFLDLNLPAPVEEDEFKPWWIATSLLTSS